MEEELHGYNEEDAAEIHEQIKNVCLTWNHFIDTVTNNDAAPGIHPPPSLMHMYGHLMTVSNPLDEFEDLLPNDDDSREAFAAAAMKMLSFGDILFRFGQFCSTQGLLHSNLVQCNCGSVDDDKLRAFIGEPT